ncbi:MAG: MarR family transcriptional regulator [Deltaproteobacteria bacterium]|nr:MarR family transcriptional regulator [Deltaproteobacteria bacterium]
MSELVSTVRTFNRFYTRVVGVLGEQHLRTGLTLGQARVLFEIGQLAPVEARALQAYLSLDRGYVSRRLAELESARLITRVRGAEDARRKPIVLTAKGRQRLALLDERSIAIVQRLTARLDGAQQRKLQSAMIEIQRLLDDDFVIARERPESPQAQACLNGYFAELARRFGFDPSQSVSADPEEMRPPRGVFLLVRCGGRPRGCGALKTLEPGVGEVKRMWIHPELRGRGAGRRLLQALEHEAGKLKLRVLKLDTSSHLSEALGLYRSAGYREIAPYNDNRFAAHWFEKGLAR